MVDKIGLLGNIVVRGRVSTLTGLHIGASADTVEIGGIDSPVIKHPISKLPYIPGSSLKGKMRSFMEKMTAAADGEFQYNRRVQNIRQHVCNDIEFSYTQGDQKGAKNCPVCRVYGSTGKNGDNHPAKIVVRDCRLMNEASMVEDNLPIFEAKMENAIDRITSAATPRTFERVPAGAEFNFEIIYKVQGEFQDQNGQYRLTDSEISNIQKDVQNIFEVLSLVERDGLGGSISRGYGQVAFMLEGEEGERIDGEIKYYPTAGEAKDIVPDEVEKTIEALRQYDFANLKDIILGGSAQ